MLREEQKFESARFGLESFDTHSENAMESDDDESVNFVSAPYKSSNHRRRHRNRNKRQYYQFGLFLISLSDKITKCCTHSTVHRHRILTAFPI